MTTPKTPVIGHVTPLPGNVESATDRRCYQDPECIGVARCGLHDTVPDWHSEIPGWTGRAGWVCPDREVNDVFGEAPPAPSGVAAIFGAAPELPEDSLLFRTLAAEVDDEDALAMPPSDIARGQEAHAVALQAYMAPEQAFSLEDARAMLVRLECVPLDIDEESEIWTMLQLACDAFERLETEVANLRGAVEMLGVAAKGAEEDVERLTKERTAADVGTVARLGLLEQAIGIIVTDPTEPLSDRLLRVRLVVLDQQRAARAKAETLARWKRKAAKAEQRVAVLEQERDGLTLRLGKRVRAKVQRAKGRRS